MPLADYNKLKIFSYKVSHCSVYWGRYLPSLGWHSAALSRSSCCHRCHPAQIGPIGSLYFWRHVLPCVSLQPFFEMVLCRVKIKLNYQNSDVEKSNLTEFLAVLSDENLLRAKESLPEPELYMMQFCPRLCGCSFGMESLCTRHFDKSILHGKKLKRHRLNMK